MAVAMMGLYFLHAHVVPALVMLAVKVGWRADDVQITMLVVAVFFAVGLAHVVYVHWVLHRRGRRVVGSVVAIDPGEGFDRPIIEFEDETGTTHRLVSHLGANAHTGSLGASVEVIYDPSNPSRAREAGRLAAKTFHIAFFGLFVVALTLLLTIVGENPA